MIKPDAYNNIGKIVDVIEKNGFNISNLKMTKLTPQDAQGIYHFEIKRILCRPKRNCLFR